jgi:hypothetical protein
MSCMGSSPLGATVLEVYLVGLLLETMVALAQSTATQFEHSAYPLAPVLSAFHQFCTSHKKPEIASRGNSDTRWFFPHPARRVMRMDVGTPHIRDKGERG